VPDARPLARAGAVRAGALAPAELSWLLAPPAALVLLAAIVVLGPPLGHLLFPDPGIAFWPTAVPTLAVRPEPVEHGRYLIAIVAPLALAGLLAWLVAGRPAPARPPAAGALVQVSQVLLVAFLALTLIAQRSLTYEAIYSGRPFRSVYFTVPTLVVAALVAGALVAGLRRSELVARARAWARETPRRRQAALAVALLLAVAWLLTALNGTDTVRNANLGVYGNYPYWIDESFAVLNGRAPLVHFHAQYSQLLPYLTGGLMALLGTSVGVYSALMATATGLTLMAVYATLRRVVRSSFAALALFVPVLATGFFMEIGPLSNRYGPSNLFSMFPMRYGGAYLLAWLTVRHVDGARPLRRVLLFGAAGLVLVNNVEFGVPAFGATLAALLCSEPERSQAAALRLARDAALGLLGAIVAVCVLTLAVAGSLPHFGWLFTFSRLWGIGGVTMLPTPSLGFHLAIYVTFAAALLVATVRTLSSAAPGTADRCLTAMLAWTGVFGLGAATYFAGRSHPEVLIDLFSAWAFALALLVVVVVRAILARPSRRPALPELAVLFAFGLAVCSIAQTPAPWSQLQRLGHTARRPPFGAAEAKRAIAAVTHRGERVAILAATGHGIAHELGIVDVAPYASILAMPAKEQLTETIRTLRREGGRVIFAPARQTETPQLEAIERAGYVLIATRGGIIELRAGG
jgi:hypothetical protein